MGLLDDITHKSYYQGNDLGNYQFVSLEDIINQFMVVYIGENKVIPKASKIDVAFHAQRALAELSFDTFKSVKSQQIDIPGTLVMPLPHDYVNYTKLSRVDSSGIKHLLYPVSATSNPFQIAQKSDGSYNFDFTTSDIGILENSDFSSDLLDSWEVITNANGLNNLPANPVGGVAIEDGKLKTSFHTRNGASSYNWGSVHAIYQAIDVSDTNYLDISALGAADTFTVNPTISYVDGNTASATYGETVLTVQNTAENPGTLRFGLSSQIPEDNYLNPFGAASIGTLAVEYVSNNINADIFDLVTVEGDPSYVEWIGPTTNGTTTSIKELELIDVSDHTTVYAVIISYVDFKIPSGASPTGSDYWGYPVPAVNANSIDDLVVTKSEASNYLIPEFGNEKNSSTWNNYKSGTPSENQDDYMDDTYWPANGERYGLDPQHAQANGSFYIDSRLGRIHFSSNISGKSVILDYISDSLGTDGEMQVHKFAEDAMYKYITHAMISGSSYGQQLVPRLTKEKFAAIRKAKLRLSNIKLEELTQILRGKSKQIKH